MYSSGTSPHGVSRGGRVEKGGLPAVTSRHPLPQMCWSLNTSEAHSSPQSCSLGVLLQPDNPPCRNIGSMDICRGRRKCSLSQYKGICSRSLHLDVGSSSGRCSPLFGLCLCSLKNTSWPLPPQLHRTFWPLHSQLLKMLWSPQP